jgi:hypothetical protein
MQVAGGKRQAVLGDGIEYSPGSGKERPFSVAVSPLTSGEIAFTSIGAPRRVLDEMPRVDRRHPDDPAALARRLQDGVLVQAADRIAQYHPRRTPESR